LPVLAKSVPRLSLEACSEVVTSSFRSIFEISKEYLQRTPMEARQPLTPARGLSHDDIRRLIHYGLIEEIHFDHACCGCSVFCVAEVAKQRKRLIIWPKEINDLFPIEPDEEFSLLTVKNQIVQTSGYTHAAVFDFATFYHQVELAKPARPFYAFLFEGKTYAICTIPTGHRHCCALAQSITASIVELAVQEVGGWSAEGCAYFDNERILTLNHEDAVKALEVVKLLCKTCGITMNAAESMVASEYVFLGVHYSHEPSGTWTNLTQKFVSKAVSAMLALQNPDASMRKVLHAFGLGHVTILLHLQIRAKEGEGVRRRFREACEVMGQPYAGVEFVARLGSEEYSSISKKLYAPHRGVHPLDRRMPFRLGWYSLRAPFWKSLCCGRSF
jgi:hypothetical protein